MRLGWDVPNVHHGFGLDAYAFGDVYAEDVAVTAHTIDQVSSRAEQVGFDAIWIADHVVFSDRSVSEHPLRYRPNSGRDDDPLEGDDRAGRYEIQDHQANHGQNKGSARYDVRSQDPVFEAITTMSYLAGRTRRCRIGVGVLVIPYRNPLLAAKMLATLDVLSGGRIILAAGVGWLKEALEALGADYENRGPITDEYLDLMRSVWRSADPRFEGRLIQIAPGLRMHPTPVQQPSIPIWIGGISNRALRRAATRGDGWLAVYQPVETIRELHTRLRALLDQAGRSPDDFVFGHRVRFQVTDADGGDQPCIGSPRRIADGIRRYREAGVDHLLLAPPPGPTTAYLLESWTGLRRTCCRSSRISGTNARAARRASRRGIHREDGPA